MAGGTTDPNGIPLPVVTLNRSLLVGGVVLGLITQQPIVITALLVMLILSLVFGPSGSLPYRLAGLTLGQRLQRSEREDRSLMRFNNSIALVLFVIAHVAFLTGAPVAGWVAAGMVAVAASIALAGFCIGCVLFFQFKQLQARFAR